MGNCQSSSPAIAASSDVTTAPSPSTRPDDPEADFYESLAKCQSSLHKMKQAGFHDELNQGRMAMGRLVHDQELFPPGTIDAFLDQDKTWTGKILTFLPEADIASVALVNKKMNKLAKGVLSKVRDSRLCSLNRDTYCSVAFYNIPCAEHWLKHWLTHDSPGKFPCSQYVCDAIAKLGKTAVLKWARSKEFPWDETTCNEAAKNGHFDTLKWLLANGRPRDDESMCFAAAWGGHFDILKWLHEKECHWNAATCHLAAEQGHLHILKWAHQNGCLWCEQTCMYAAVGGHLHILKWLREHGCPWDENTTDEAIYNHNGDFELLKWAHNNGCPLPAKSYCILEWAHQNGYPWDSQACINAAIGGHLHILKWLGANGCPWNYETTAEAASKGHFDVLKWAYENGCLLDLDACLDLVPSDRLDMLQWLRGIDT
ncbi:ankyrin repeat protein [Seminavis robusta]|uniref:Ankyrin repeat protein n=1 Tax=Seminavis robusta TaxID=568900 RepID=A0A9N8HIF2_9STRA|nr:ankyrin repeat protein [Seminavis robusta]|eukprot:Sro591_g171980.1 ankyrin repeat protein (428) ;mRNA; f:11687-13272